MKKSLLLIMNPVSGKLKGISNKDLIIEKLSENYDVTLKLTAARGDGTLLAREYAPEFDVVGGCGGDGTLNEVMVALRELPLENRPPMICIPAGTTNLLGDTIGLPKNVIRTTERIIAGSEKDFDLATFNEHIFACVASFGAFTDTSYATSQRLKNMLGYGAYVVGGAKSLFHLRNYPMTFRTEDEVFDDSFIFGSVSNCRAVGGVVKFNEDALDVSDGVYELVLIRKIHNPMNLARIIRAMLTKNYESCSEIIYRKVSSLNISAPDPMPWTIDGEYKGDFSDVEINVEKHALKLVF